MAEQNNEYRDTEDLGNRSPASDEAKEQNASGQRGGPRSEGQRSDADHQVPQTSGRRGAQHEENPEERKHFEAGQAPSEQGEKDHPSPHVIAQGQGQQGVRGQSPSHGAHREQSEEEAQGGSPQGTHTRSAQHGRQQMPGDR
jgi:hypothetical protein